MKLLVLIFSIFYFSVSFSQTDSIGKVKAKIDDLENGSGEKFSLLEEVVSYYSSNNADSALVYAQKQLDLSSVLGDENFKLKASFNLAKLYFQLGDYANCTKYALSSIQLSKEQGDNDGQVRMLCLMGRMHASKNEFASSYETYEKAEKIALSDVDEKLLIPVYIGIGNAKFLENKIAEAEVNFQKCLEIYERHPDFEKETIATIYTNLGNIQAGYENDLASIEYYKKSLEIYLGINDLYGASLTMFNIGDAYMFAGEYDSSLVYFKRNLAIGEKLKSNEEIYYAYFGMTNLSTKMGEFENALKYQVLASAYKDTIQKMKYDKSVVEMQKKYEFEQSQKALKIAELEVVKAKENERRDSLIMKSDANKIAFLWIGAAALLVISLIIFFLYRMVSNSNKVIQEQNSEIHSYNVSMDKTLKQKEVLLKEVHHRVKNNLQIIASLLNLQINRMENKLAKEAVEESRNRVQAIALMHKGLYQDEHYNKVNVETYLKELINQQKLFSVVNGNEIGFKLDVDPILLSIDDAVPMGLILSELISNSVKHAFNNDDIQPIIAIKVTQLKEGVVINYGDNGKGISDDFILEKSDTLGFEIILALTEQINGKIVILSRCPLELELKF
jgi:two-component sensor histidine kinase